MNQIIIKNIFLENYMVKKYLKFEKNNKKKIYKNFNIFSNYMRFSYTILSNIF